MWDTIEHVALIAIVINTCLQAWDILYMKTIIHKEYEKDKDEK